MTFKKLVIYADGASRGNPGPAAIGVVIQYESGKTVATISECLGNTTNNQAEYRAVIAGLEKAISLGASHVELRSDSELLVQQLSGKYRVKNEALKPLFLKTQALRGRFAAFEVKYIPREENGGADKLANRALDALKSEKNPAPGSNPIIVRPAVKKDYPAIVGVFVEMEKQHVEAVPQFFRTETRAEHEHDLDAIMAAEDEAVLVAERDGIVLGYIHLALQAEENRPGLVPRRYVKIRDLAVAGRYQRSGAGSMLMRAAESWAREHGVASLDLNVWEFNRAAQVFYQEMGYTTASRHMWKWI